MAWRFGKQQLEMDSVPYCRSHPSLRVVVQPLQAAMDLIARSRQALNHSKSMGASIVKDDIARQSLVVAVAGLDTYMHWLVMARLSAQRESLPSKLGSLGLPLEDVAAAADNVLANRQGARPWVSIKHAVRKQLLRKTFQSSSDWTKRSTWQG